MVLSGQNCITVPVVWVSPVPVGDAYLIALAPHLAVPVDRSYQLRGQSVDDRYSDAVETS